MRKTVLVLFLRLSVVGLLVWIEVFLDAVHAIFETFHSFAQAFHQLRDFLSSKQEKNNKYDEYNFRCSKHNINV